MAQQPDLGELRKRLKKQAANSKRTPERANAILGALQTGASREAAAANAGVNYNTLWRWMSDDPAMAEMVESAEAASEVTYATRIYQAAQTTWQAAAWMLERRWPKKYGRRDRTDITIETRRLAETIATQHGLDAEALLADAQAIIDDAREANRRADG